MLPGDVVAHVEYVTRSDGFIVGMLMLPRHGSEGIE